jgi:hypothetical protein
MVAGGDLHLVRHQRLGASLTRLEMSAITHLFADVPVLGALAMLPPRTPAALPSVQQAGS